MERTNGVQKYSVDEEECRNSIRCLETVERPEAE